jgi:hypothetical protein
LLGRAEASWSASPEHDYTLSFKLARWRDVSAEAAAACVAGRDSTEGARYRRQFDILGVTFSVDGVFLPLGKGDVVQLEMVAPLGSRPAYESLYQAWIARHTVGAEMP